MTTQLDDNTVHDTAIDVCTRTDVDTSTEDTGGGEEPTSAQGRRRHWVVPVCVVAVVAAAAVVGVMTLRDRGSEPSAPPASAEAEPSSYELTQQAINNALAER